MGKEINYCKASMWSVQRIEDELNSAGIGYRILHDDAAHCGTVVVTEEKDFDIAANIVLYYTELRA